MEMQVKAQVCGPCYRKDGTLKVAIRQFTVALSAGYLGANDDTHTDGVITVCADHAAAYDEILTTFQVVTDDAVMKYAAEQANDSVGFVDGEGQWEDFPETDTDTDDEDDDQDDEDELTAAPVSEPAEDAAARWAAVPGAAEKKAKAYNATVRAWAKSQGYSVTERGRIKDEIYQAFKTSGMPGLPTSV